MVFAPMQTGAGTGSDSAGGRRVTDNFSPRTRAPLSRRILVSGRSGRRDGEGRWGLPEFPSLSRGDQVSRRLQGRCPCRPAGRGEDHQRELQAGRAPGRERKPGPGRTTQPTSVRLSSPPRPPTTYADISFIASCVFLTGECLSHWSLSLVFPFSRCPLCSSRL